MSERDVYVEPPSELHLPGLVAKLNKTMFGTQDASNAWMELRGNTSAAMALGSWEAIQRCTDRSL